MAHDSQFRKQATAGACTHWFKLILSLMMVVTVFSTGGDHPSRACQLYFDIAHHSALTSLEGYKAPARMPALGHNTQRSKPHCSQEDICRWFKGASAHPQYAGLNMSALPARTQAMGALNARWQLTKVEAQGSCFHTQVRIISDKTEPHYSAKRDSWSCHCDLLYVLLYVVCWV